jgi:hypothetical protein
MKIISFLVCDDIRNEVGNKYSLMGVYGDAIDFRVAPMNKDKWPKRMRLGFFVSMKREKNISEKNIESFSLNLDYNGKIKELGKGEFRPREHPKVNQINLVVISNNFEFHESGEIKFFLDFFDASNKLVEKITPDYSLRVSENIIKSPVRS